MSDTLVSRFALRQFGQFFEVMSNISQGCRLKFSWLHEGFEKKRQRLFCGFTFQSQLIEKSRPIEFLHRCDIRRIPVCLQISPVTKLSQCHLDPVEVTFV